MTQLEKHLSDENKARHLTRHKALSLQIKKLKCLLLIIGCIPLLGAIKSIPYQVKGIDGDILLNVQYRLNELYQNKPISNEPPEVLSEQIVKAMQPFGFFKPQIRLSGETSGKQLTIFIIPGPQMHITKLHVAVKGEGATNTEIKQAIHALPIKAGQPFDNTRYEDAKEKLFSAAEHQGYLHATFEKSEVLIDLKHYRTDITLLFNTGPQYYFGQIRFDPTYISPELLSRYVRFKYGFPYATEQLLALNTNLEASGYFKSVVVKPQISDNPYVPIFVHLQPNSRINYTLGAGYGTDTGPRGSAGLSIIPVNHAGHKFNASLQGSMNENALLAQYLIPGRNPTIDNYSINGSFTNLNYSSGYGNAALLSLAQQHALTNFQRILSINALDERYHYTNESNKIKNLFYPKASFTWREVTDQLFSPSGYNLTVSGLAAPKLMRTGVSMAQTSADAKVAITVEPIRTRFYFHAMQGVTAINHINNLPLSLAMLLGGSENLKGYSFNAIGPGRILTYGGVEIQKETFKKWYFVGFLDSGDVYNPSWKQFKYDTGIGLMWVSPVGPIKVGVAQAIDNHFNRIPQRNPKLVINMGPDL